MSMDLLKASEALYEAKMMLLHWGSYTDNYFKEKWNFDADIKKLDTLIKECEEAHRQQVEAESDSNYRVKNLYKLLDQTWW